MAGGLSRDERPALDRALRATYEAAGIGPTQRPTTGRRRRLADLVDEPRRAAGGAKRWPIGSSAGRPARWPRSSRPIGRCRSMTASSSSGSPRSAIPRSAPSPSSPRSAVLWDAVRRDLSPSSSSSTRPGRSCASRRAPTSSRSSARSARHYHAGLQLATQDIAEFLRSDFGEAIVKQCDIRVLLGQTPEGVDALGRYFDPDRGRAAARSSTPAQARASCSSGAATSRSRPGQQARVRMAHHPSSRPARPVPL